MQNLKQFYSGHKKIIRALFSLFLVFAILTPVMLILWVPSGLESAAKKLDSYHITLNYNPIEKILEGMQEFTFQNQSGKNWQDVRFHLYPAAYREDAKYKPVGELTEERAYPNEKDYGGIEIQSVRKNNADVSFEIGGLDKDILVVKHPLSAGKKDKLIISFIVTIPNIHHRFGWGENTVNLANFYPILCVFEDGWVTNPYSPNGDPFYSDVANYSVTLSHPNELKLANTGEKIKTETGETTTNTTMSALAVRDFTMVLSDKFEMQKTNVGDVEILYYYYDDANPTAALSAAADAIRTFGEMFGRYCYKTFSVVKSNFVHGGMEYPSLVYVSDEVDTLDSYLNVIIHETAHQWWSQMVGSNAYVYGWMDEGLTDYSTALFYEMNPSYGLSRKEILSAASRSYQMFVKVYKEVFGSINTEMNRPLNDFLTEMEYVNIAYVKGMLLFDSLRSLTSDRTFFKGLQIYFETYQFIIATPNDLIKCFEKASGRNLKGFFSAWIDGKVIIDDFS